MAERNPTALVTGASAGLGEEFCRQLASRCESVIAVARRGERLQSLAAELGDTTEVHIVEADLSTMEGTTRVVECLRQKGPVDILVNCAGFSTFGHFADQRLDSQQQMIALHCDASIALCRAAIPFMREAGGGRIINVASVGALLPGKGLATYGATKAFLTYFSQALQAELSGSGILVQALCPGYVRSEFHQEMQAAGFDPSRIPAEMWMEAREVVAESLAALDSERVMLVPGELNRSLARAGLQAQLDAI